MREHLDDGQLEQLLQDQLDTETRSAAESHLGHCDDCMRRLADHGERLADEVDAFRAEADSPHPDFDRGLAARLRNALEAEETSPPGDEAEARTQLRLVATVGSGGLGQVYEYTDTTFERAVAIKVLQRRWAQVPSYVQRFRREMEITATIDHPGCPAVHGAGRTGDGRDFFWMQLVTGPTLESVITAFHQGERRQSRRANTEFRRLLEAFRNICQTIAAAHERGILHRDLKPQNVRVHRDGHPVVLDWGLAKRRDTRHEPAGESAPADHTQTQHGVRIGTPLYMSPEQARGEVAQLDERTDVYGLGALLHEILTGDPPHAELTVLHADKSDLVAAIGRGHVPRLEGVPAELASICRKALAREPGNRYAGASELAAEIERWLAGDAVREHRYGLLGRTALGIRRQPLAFAAAALATIVLVTAGIATWQAWSDAKTQQAIAAERFTLALDMAKELVVGTQEKLIESGGTQEVRQGLLTTAINKISELVAKAEGQPGAEHVAIRGRLELAHLERRERRNLAEAEEQYQQIVNDLRTFPKRLANTTEHFKLLADAVKGVAECEVAINGSEAAKPWFDELHQLALEFERMFPDEPVGKLILSQALVWQGRLAERREGDGSQAAIRFYDQAHEALVDPPGSKADDPVYIYERLLALGEVAAANSRGGNHADAAVTQQRVVEGSRELAQRFDTKINRTGLALDLMSLGTYQSRADHLDESLDAYRESRQIVEELRAEFPSDQSIRRLESDVLHNLATVRRAAGQPQEAITILNELWADPASWDAATATIDYLLDQALVNAALGNVYEDLEDYAQAWQHFREALRLRDLVFQRDPSDLSNMKQMLIAGQRCLSYASDASRQDETRATIDQLVTQLDGASQADQWDDDLQLTLARLYYFQGHTRLDAAETSPDPRTDLAQALEIFERCRALLHAVPGVPAQMIEDVSQRIEECQSMIRGPANTAPPSPPEPPAETTPDATSQVNEDSHARLS